MGVVNEAVEDGVGEGRIADDLAPLLDRNLAGDDRRSALMAVLQDFEEIALFGLCERRQTPVVQDQELDAREAFEQAAIAAVPTSERDGRSRFCRPGRPFGRGRRRSSSCRRRTKPRHTAKEQAAEA